MSRRGGVGLAVVLVAGGVLIGVPMLMVMVLMGGQADLGGVCSPESGSVQLAGGTADGQLDSEQLANASAIISEGYRLGVPRRGILVALAVAHQESGFQNYANDGTGGDLAADQTGIFSSLDYPHDAVGTDHGSLGVFQQQWPWWGSMPELMDPATAARKFYLRLQAVPGWQHMSVTEAGQAVQKSRYPDAYADDESIAASLLDAAPQEGDAGQTAVYYGSTANGGCKTAAAFTGRVVFPLAPWATYVDLHNYGGTGSHWESTHTGTDLSTPCGTPIRAATDGTVTVRTDQPWAGKWLVEIDTGNGGVMTWYAHMQSLSVKNGDRVSAGQEIGAVGDLGNATGCHLHFEVHPTGGDASVNPTQWLHDNVGHDLGVQAASNHQQSSAKSEAVTLMTADLPYAVSQQQARAQLGLFLRHHTDVLLIHDVASRPVSRMLASLPGAWSVWQPPGRRGDSAIIWDADEFTESRHGVVRGAKPRGKSSWMPWVLLESDQGTLPVLSAEGANSPLPARETRRVAQVVSQMNDAGYPPVVGGHWSSGSSTDASQELRKVGLTSPSGGGPSCKLTSRVGGFAYNSNYLQLGEHGCLSGAGGLGTAGWVTLAPR